MVSGRTTLQQELTLAQKPKALDHFEFGDLRSIFEDGNTVYRLKKSELLDFAGPGRRVYQVTTQDDHSMKIKGMTRLLIMGGYLEEEAEGADKKIVRVHPPPQTKLEYYWVVPFGKQDAWKAKVPKSYATGDQKGASDVKTLLNECLEKYVKQYVLVMEIEPPPLLASKDDQSN
jgi:hypothetical protein